MLIVRPRSFESTLIVGTIDPRERRWAPDSVDIVPEQPSQRPFWIALSGFGVLVLIALGLLIWNLVNHATHPVSVTPVTTNVVSVTPEGDAAVTIVATVTSRGAAEAKVTCLVGVERPSTPLAYPTKVTRQLAPGETTTITVTRQLIKPEARYVATKDIAFTCS